MFGKLFGKKDGPAAKPKIDPAEAMRKIQESCDIISKRAGVLENRVNDMKKEALTLKKAGNNRGALMKMKQIKSTQNELAKLDGQSLMLE